ncbi:MAG TPA: RHS repeat-associated core domain-containing protein [Verrucomicrobiae bacterium]|nr:RHS repeat-associated core domain-containing protein [Verrucomicrobiae bacterium]
MKTRCILPILMVSSGLLLGTDAFAFYNPTTGRWLSRDPIEYADGPNLYEHVRNDPIVNIDADG